MFSEPAVGMESSFGLATQGSPVKEKLSPSVGTGNESTPTTRGG